jgi:hypothetical protein
VVRVAPDLSELDELRRFVASRAKESGDREKYLALQFAQATDGLTLQKYKAFKKMCKKAEWERFEPKVLAHMEDAWRTEQLKIRMHRKEHAEAMAILAKGRYPTLDRDAAAEIRTAKKAASEFPAVVLTGPRQSGKTTLFQQTIMVIKIYS